MLDKKKKKKKRFWAQTVHHWLLPGGDSSPVLHLHFLLLFHFSLSDTSLSLGLALPRLPPTLCPNHGLAPVSVSLSLCLTTHLLYLSLLSIRRSPVSLFLRLAISSGLSKLLFICTRMSMFSITSFCQGGRGSLRHNAGLQGERVMKRASAWTDLSASEELQPHRRSLQSQLSMCETRCGTASFTAHQAACPSKVI